MADSVISTALVGCTGLVGSQILSTLLSLPANSTVHALARRALPSEPSNLKPHISTNTSTWPQFLMQLTPPPNAFISALGTTRGQAGSFEAQYAIDYDLNLALARAAKESGVQVYILISSSAVSATSMLPYSRMKGTLEIAVKEIGFPYTVIIKPRLLMGKRNDSRPPEAFVRGIAKGLGVISKTWLTDWWTTDVDVIGRATVRAAMQCIDGKRKEGVWQIDQSEILELGKPEWKDEA